MEWVGLDCWRTWGWMPPLLGVWDSQQLPGVTPAVAGQCLCPQLSFSMLWALLGDFLMAQS